MEKLTYLFLVFLFTSSITFGQLSSSSSNQEFALDPAKVAKFEKYDIFLHSFEPGGFAGWKAANPDLYNKEMWYYTESFYIKRDYLSEGITMDESMIDVNRFEKQRLPTQEAVVTFPGFKDVMVLLPKNKMFYTIK